MAAHFIVQRNSSVAGITLFAYVRKTGASSWILQGMVSGMSVTDASNSRFSTGSLSFSTSLAGYPSVTNQLFTIHGSTLDLTTVPNPSSYIGHYFSLLAVNNRGTCDFNTSQAGGDINCGDWEFKITTSPDPTVASTFPTTCESGFLPGSNTNESCSPTYGVGAVSLATTSNLAGIVTGAATNAYGNPYVATNTRGGFTISDGANIVVSRYDPGNGTSVINITSTTAFTRLNSGTPLQSEFTAIVKGSSLYVAVGPNGKIATSPDKINWTARSSGNTLVNFQSIDWSGSLYVAVGVQSQPTLDGHVIFTSSDGITWSSTASWTTTGVADPYSSAGGFNRVRWTGSTWLLCGRGANATNTAWTLGIHSYTGSGGTYTQRLSIGGSGGNSVWNTIRDIAVYGSTLVAIGVACTATCSNLTGTTWVTGTFTSSVYALAYNGTTLVGVGPSGSAYTSTNGTSWTTQSTTYAADLVSIAWNATVGDGTFLANSITGSVICSTNSGVTWVGLNLNVSNNVFTATSNGVLTVDSVVVSGTPSILLKDQTNQQQNGIWAVSNAGSSTTPWILQNQNKLGYSGWCSVNSGTINSGKRFFQTVVSTNFAEATNVFVETDCAGILCSTGTSGSGGGSVGPTGPQGPAGPTGPQGPAGVSGGGLKYVGDWTTGTQYYFESGTPSSTSIVRYKDVMYICIVAHTADASTEPGIGISWETNWVEFSQLRRLRWMGDWADSFYYQKSDVVRGLDGGLYVALNTTTSNNNNEPGYGITWTTDWDLLNTAGGLGSPADQNFFDQLKNNVFDWMKNATVGDWLGALAIGAGIVWAGSTIIDAITGNGAGDGHADTRYNGSPAYTGTITAPTLPVVIASLMDFAGFSSGSIDVSLLPSTPLNFTISGTVNVRAALNQLALAYQFDIISSGSTIKFVPKYQSTVRSLTTDDLGHVKDSTVGGVKYAAKRMQGIDLPRSVTLKYYSAAIDQNIFTQTSTLETYTEGQDSIIEVPFTMTDAQAKTITETVLVNSHIEQQQYSFTTDYHNIDLEPSDVITIPLDTGGSTQVRIIEINETDDGLLEFTTTRSDYNSYSYVSSGAGATVPPSQPSQVITSIGYSQTLFLEVPPLNDNDGTTPRIKALVHGYARAGWPGASVYRSTDGGNSYSLLTESSALSTFGMVATATPAPTDYRIWDTTTTISVTVKQGTLLSAASDLAVQNGANWCMVGEEVIGFTNATLTGTSGGLNVYSISRLLRGRAGSELKCTTHQANELFVLLDDTLVDIPITTADLGKTVKTKTVTIGSDISKVAAVDVQPFGLNMRPWAPAQVTKVRQPNNDWVITWVERARTNNDLRDYTEISHDPDYAGFAWAVLSGSTVKNKGTTTDMTYTYTAAQQVTDFGSVQATLTGSITQMSTIVGGGYPGVF